MEVKYDIHCLKVEKNSSPLAFLEAEIIGRGRGKGGVFALLADEHFVI